MDDEIQNFIVKGLLENRNYFRRVVNNLDPKYFSEEFEPVISEIRDYHNKYDKVPDYSVLVNVLSNKDFSDSLLEKIESTVGECKDMDFNPSADEEWLFDETKQFANDRAVFKVLQEGAHELNKDEKKRDYGRIYNKMQSAISIDWDEDLGYEYSDLVEFDSRYDRLQDVSKRIPTGIKKIDEAIGGGILGATKFLGVYAGSAGLGKTLILGNTTVNAVKDGKNVLYISFEISQDELGKRVDAAFTGLKVNELTSMKKEVKRRIKEEYSKSEKPGRLIIKEYPPSAVNANEVEAYVQQLKLKRDFSPDIIVLDYLGIMKPIQTMVANSYEKGKFVSEELRALSSKLNVPILSATQYNRSGYNKETVGLEAMADSMAIAHTADLVISLTQTDEDKENSHVRFEVTKSRLSAKGMKGIMNVDYETLSIRNDVDEDEENESVSDTIEIVKKAKKANKLKGSSGIS